MAAVATKRQAESKAYKIKYKPLKELEKGTPHKDVASLSLSAKKTLRIHRIMLNWPYMQKIAKIESFYYWNTL